MRMKKSVLNLIISGPESCGIVAPPFVVSVSYGQDESTVTPAFANRQCTEYAKVHSFISITIHQGGCVYDVSRSLACWVAPFSTAVVMMVLLVEVESALIPDVGESFSSSDPSSTFRTTDQPSSGGKVFNPGFPVTCPFVTAVGATQVNPGKTVNDPEGACEQVIFSGGGFSNIFP